MNSFFDSSDPDTVGKGINLMAQQEWFFLLSWVVFTCFKDSSPNITNLSVYLFRFQSSKSGKIYLHRDVRLLFSRKSMEVDSGAAYELKSYTESPTNPQFSPRCWWGDNLKVFDQYPGLDMSIHRMENTSSESQQIRVALLCCSGPDFMKRPLKWDPWLLSELEAPVSSPFSYCWNHLIEQLQ